MIVAPSSFLPLALILTGASFAAEKPVSWYHDVTPIFKRSCNGCHNPNKLKGEVDTSTFAGFLKPGKHGPSFVPGDPAKSRVIEQISGDEPDMPKEGDPLSAADDVWVDGRIITGENPASAARFAEAIAAATAGNRN
ncbi:MAG TPA: hypothetical protein DCE44_19400 [Verrucomicrobiales bacterium]|nr:hypothetical protein [Verrucomicrobiales bacterium]